MSSLKNRRKWHSTFGFLVVSGLLIGIVFYVMSFYVSEFRIVMSATISVLNVRFSFTPSCL
jgi:hypothetical protein